MEVLIGFFLKYLLAPVLVIASAAIMNVIAKGRSVLKMKRLIIFILISAIIVALPSLLGILKYEFVWGGLIIAIVFYLLLGLFFNFLSKSKFFEKIGFNGNQWIILFSYLVIAILAGWIFYLVFTWLSKLNYGIWVMTVVLWFLLPPLYKFSKEKFISIPETFYKSWYVRKKPADEEYWNTIDTFRLMQVNLKVKRRFDSPQYSSFSVKIPEDVSLGMWYNRFIEDQNIRFPSTPVELSGPDGEYGWIFYTNKWFPFPLFTRTLDFEKEVRESKIKNKTTIYAKRVSKSEDYDKE
ncbi:TssN family type VI secretion system protein [Flagellimonas marinaquae]|uniref:TssN family type VI secretion system protein n=1 Tax=Flagellimonas marinaquae TaxID=254955 RepID=UPI00207601EB|nr:TssN family type VI secretion system protein [Allomuricauda aquimarina]USD26870.1 TssN family type VI secretion system protein [Allomuricauda aquimarina]